MVGVGRVIDICYVEGILPQAIQADSFVVVDPSGAPAMALTGPTRDAKSDNGIPVGPYPGAMSYRVTGPDGMASYHATISRLQEVANLCFSIAASPNSGTLRVAAGGDTYRTLLRSDAASMCIDESLLNSNSTSASRVLAVAVYAAVSTMGGPDAKWASDVLSYTGDPANPPSVGHDSRERMARVVVKAVENAPPHLRRLLGLPIWIGLR